MLFTSEQVSHGHPDKICDQISDAILTDCLAHDRNSRVAVETLIKDNHVTLAGEITSRHIPNYQAIVQHQLAQHEPQIADSFVLTQHISRQSPDIAQGVDRKGAGDQGMMFGYACKETAEMLPLPFALATKAIEILEGANHPALLPDAKAQVTYDYKNNRINTFLISTQHVPDVPPAYLAQLVHYVMKAAAREYSQNEDFRFLINPTGRFVNGGSFADTGSSPIPTAVLAVMAAGPSPARIPQRWTAPVPIWRGRSPRTFSAMDLPAVVKYSSPMPSGWKSRSASPWKPSRPAKCPTATWSAGFESTMT